MEKNFELLNVGATDMVSILSLDEMDDVVGGDVLCTKDYTVYGTGGFSCGCGYSLTETPKLPTTGGSTPIPTTPKDPKGD